MAGKGLGQGSYLVGPGAGRLLGIQAELWVTKNRVHGKQYMCVHVGCVKVGGALSRQVIGIERIYLVDSVQASL